MFRRFSLCQKCVCTLALVIPGVAGAQPNDDPYFACGGRFDLLAFGSIPFDTSTATTSLQTESACIPQNGPQIYNDLWYFFVAPCTGWYTVDTCGSSFDTKIAAYDRPPYHVEEGCGGICIVCIPDHNTAIACSDDACGFQSAVTFFGVAEQGYTIRVGAYASDGRGAGTLTLTGPRCGYPSALITSPTPLSCNCLPITITGTADAPFGFSNFTLEARPAGSSVWSVIHMSTTPVPPQPLFVWNDLSLTEGYYELRLTVEDIFSQIAQDEVTIYINRAYDAVVVRSPVDYNSVTGVGIYGGEMCIDGTVQDSCGLTYSIEYASLATGPYAPVNPGFPTYPGGVINDPIGLNWNTRTGPTAVADGFWFVRVTGLNNCGQVATTTRRVLVDNTAPVGQITSPLPCSYVDDVVPIRGTATDANISGWILQYTGGGSSTWTTIASGNSNVGPNGLLANWNTSGLTPCPYTLRLIVSDKAIVSCIGSNSTEYEVSIDLGCRGDFNRSGTLNSQDLFDFLTAFFTGCP